MSETEPEMWTATLDDLSAALAAGEAGSPEDWQERLNAALACLRGWSVIRDVSVYHGEVWIPDQSLHVSGDSKIDHCQVFTEGPVIVRVERLEQFAGNKGNAIQAVEVHG